MYTYHGGDMPWAPLQNISVAGANLLFGELNCRNLWYAQFFHVCGPDVTLLTLDTGCRWAGLTVTLSENGSRLVVSGECGDGVNHPDEVVYIFTRLNVEWELEAIIRTRYTDQRLTSSIDYICTYGNSRQCVLADTCVDRSFRVYPSSTHPDRSELQ